MRYAGQRFRAQRQSNPNYRAQSGANGNFRAPSGSQGMEAAMQQKPAVNVSSMAFTQMPSMANQDFNFGSMANGQFNAPTRIR